MSEDGFTAGARRHFSEPAFVVTYGPSGIGKTADCLFSFPGALYVAAPGALKPWKNVVGMPAEPAFAPNARTIDDVTLLINAEKSKRRWKAIVIDDFSLMSDVTMNGVEAKFPKGGMPMWGAIRRIIMDFRTAAREAGMHVIANCHIRNPHVHEKKGWIQGGPMLPGTMPEDFPKSVDVCLRVVKEESYPDWPFIYGADPRNGDYVEKTRLGEAVSALPMNLGEILRLDYGVEGPLGIGRIFDWQEKVVEKASSYLTQHDLGSPEWRAVAAALQPLVLEKAKGDVLVARWTLRDAVARGVLRRLMQKNLLAAYG